MRDIGSPIAERVETRIGTLKEAMEREGVLGVVCVAPANQAYLTAFRALLYSRPLVLLVRVDRSFLIVPGLEEGHARNEAIVDEVHAYYEHPTDNGRTRSHLDLLDNVLSAEPGARIGVEFAACPTGLTRHLSDAGYVPVDLGPTIAAMRAVKDDFEMKAITDSAKLVATGVSGSISACRAGATEIEVDGVGTTAVLEALAKRKDVATVDQLVMTPSGTERSILPHAFSTTRRLEHGDVLNPHTTGRTQRVSRGTREDSVHRLLRCGPAAPVRRDADSAGCRQDCCSSWCVV